MPAAPPLSVASLLSESAEQLRELLASREHCAAEASARLAAEERSSAAERERDETETLLSAMRAEVELWRTRCLALRHPERLLTATEPIVSETAQALHEQFASLREAHSASERTGAAAKRKVEDAVVAACLRLNTLCRRGKELYTDTQVTEKENRDTHTQSVCHYLPSFSYSSSSCGSVATEGGSTVDEVTAVLAHSIGILEEQWTAALSLMTEVRKRAAVQKEELHLIRAQRDAALETQYEAQEDAQGKGDELKKLYAQYRYVLRSVRQQYRVLHAAAPALVKGKVKALRTVGPHYSEKKKNKKKKKKSMMKKPQCNTWSALHGTAEESTNRSGSLPLHREEAEELKEEETKAFIAGAEANDEKALSYHHTPHVSQESERYLSQSLALPALTAPHQRALRSLLCLSRTGVSHIVAASHEATRTCHGLTAQLREAKRSHGTHTTQLRRRHTQSETALREKIAQCEEVETTLRGELTRCTRRAEVAERALDAMRREERQLRRALQSAESTVEETRTILTQHEATAREHAFDLRTLRERCDGLETMSNALEAHATRSHSHCEGLYNAIRALVACIACVAARATRARAARESMTYIYATLDKDARACRAILRDFASELCDAKPNDEEGYVWRPSRASLRSVGIAVRTCVRLVRIAAERRRAIHHQQSLSSAFVSVSSQSRRRVVFAVGDECETSVRRVAAPFLYGSDMSLPVVRLPPLPAFLRAMAQSHERTNPHAREQPGASGKEETVREMEGDVFGGQHVLQWLSIAELDMSAPATRLSLGSDIFSFSLCRPVAFATHSSISSEPRGSLAHMLRDILTYVRRRLCSARAQLCHQSASIARAAAETERFSSERTAQTQTQAELRNALAEEKATSARALCEVQLAAQQRIREAQEEWEKERHARREAEAALQALQTREVDLTRELRTAHDEVRSLSLELASTPASTHTHTSANTSAVPGKGYFARPFRETRPDPLRRVTDGLYVPRSVPREALERMERGERAAAAGGESVHASRSTN